MGRKTIYKFNVVLLV